MLNFFKFSFFLGGIIPLLSGIFILLEDRKQVMNRTWFGASVGSAIWSLGFLLMITASTEKASLFWRWFMESGSIFIPVFWLHFIYSFLGINKERGRLLFFIYIGTFILWFLNLSELFFSKLFVVEMIQKGVFQFYPTAGVGYIWFLLFFFLVVFHSLIVLYKNYKRSSGIKASQIKYLLLASTFGFFGGGTTFLLTFNILINPYGIILFALYPIVIAYAVTKHHLFNIKVIAIELLTFSIWIFILIRLFLAENTQEKLLNGGLLIFIIVAGIFLIRSVIKEVRLREQIEKLAEDLKVANQGQASLMHFMNHQVKGRFGNAKNIFAELLTDDYGEMPEDAKPLLQKGLDETNLGINYVQNILKGASAENGTLPFEMKPIDFKSIVEEVASKQKDYADKKSLEFSVEVANGAYNMNGDMLQLSEAVKNLIDNSINYTQTGSIKVRLLNSPTHANNMRFEVKDTGVGLTDDDKTKLFKSGGRGADSLKVNTNSTGYGLVFVKGVIEAHKGSVWAESQGRGKGSVFIVELPRNDSKK